MLISLYYRIKVQPLSFLPINYSSLFDVGTHLMYVLRMVRNKRSP